MAWNERGKQGDHGQTGGIGHIGDRGEVGKRGDPGDRGRTGLEGERGKQGDSGRDGREGGQGEAGPAGPRGASFYKQLVVMFLFTVLAFTALALLVQRNTDSIAEEAQKGRMERCVGGVAVLNQFNTFLTNMAQVEQDGIDSGEDPAVTPTRKSRIKIYKSALVAVPDCSKVK